MPIFHCPVGAAYYDSDSCIHCEMCHAKTAADKVRATEIIREYLRNEGAANREKYKIKKVAVCGKGGVGKSTIVANMALALHDLGYRVLVIDTDESNPGLGRKLGAKANPAPLLELTARFSTDQFDKAWFYADTLTINDIPATFRSESDGIDFMMSGKIDNPLQGCACAMGELVKDLLEKIELYDKEIVLVDNEAGVESFGRGLEQQVDTVITVAEPSIDSLELSKIIYDMAQGIGIGRIRTIVNKVPAEMNREITKALREQKIPYLGIVEQSSEVQKNSLYGRPIERDATYESILAMTKLMLDEAEMPYLEE